MSVAAGRRRGRVARHALLIASAGATASSAVVSALPLVIADSLVRERQWSEATLLGGISAGMLLSVAAAPLGAFLIARVGLRRTIAGVSCVLLGMLLLSVVDLQPRQLALVWALGIGASGCIGPMVVGSVVTAERYPQHCATASGLFLSCALAAPMLALPLSAVLIESLGRVAVISTMAVVVVAAISCAAVFIPDRCRSAQVGNAALASRRSVAASARDGNFWLLLVLTCVCGVTSTGLVGNHLISICRVEGLSASSGAGAVAASGIAAVIGGLAFGAAADRLSGMRLLAAYYFGRAVLLLWLPLSSFSLRELSEFAVLYGLDSAATMPALVRIGLDRFGRLQIGGVMSILAVAHHGAAAATTFAVAAAGPQYYPLAFAAGGVLCLVAGLLLVVRPQSISQHLCLARLQQPAIDAVDLAGNGRIAGLDPAAQCAGSIGRDGDARARM